MDNVREIEFRSYGATELHPIVLVFTVAMCVLVVRSKRSHAILPLMLISVLVTHAQRIVVLDLDFSMQRIVIIAALLRALVKGELRSLRPLTLDGFVVAWVVSAIFMGFARDPSMSTLVNRLGFSVDSLGMYLAARCFIRAPVEVLASVRMLAWILLPLSLAMIYEHITARNLFDFMGAKAIAGVRDGSTRSQGTLGHPILAGSFGASAVPLMIALFLARSRERVSAVVGGLSALAVAMTTASSGPAICLLAGLGAWSLWFVRRFTREILVGSAAMVIVIHLIREKPVWHLIGRLSELIGGTGYHRVRLIDAWVANFDDWWLRGTKNTMYWGWGLQDTTNWFVANSVDGGLLTLVAFVAMLVVSFRVIGHARRARRRISAGSPLTSREFEYLTWGMGASLFAHCLAWISVSYFGTMKLIFFLELALLAGIAAPLRERHRRADRRLSAASKAVPRRRAARESQPASPLAAPDPGTSALKGLLAERRGEDRSQL